MHIPKQDKGLDHVEAADEDGSVKEGCPVQATARPLVHFQLVTYGEDEITFQAGEVGDGTSELPAWSDHQVSSPLLVMTTK